VPDTAGIDTVWGGRKGVGSKSINSRRKTWAGQWKYESTGRGKVPHKVVGGAHPMWGERGAMC